MGSFFSKSQADPDDDPYKPQTTAEIVEHLKYCTDAGEHIDIFQMLAFRWRHPGKEWTTFWAVFAKAMLAFAGQTVGMVVVLSHNVFTKMFSMVSWCDSPPGMGLERYLLGVMSTLFGLIIIVFAMGEFRSYRQFGFYRIDPTSMHNCPDLMDPRWLSFGRFANTIVMLMVLCGSVIIMWLSNDPNDIVLNGMKYLFSTHAVTILT